MTVATFLRCVAISFGLAGTALAQGTPSGAPADWPEPVMDEKIRAFVFVDQLEYRLNDGDDILRWEAEGWLGGDYNKLAFKTEGEYGPSSSAGDAELQLLYGRTIATFWDFQIGARQDVLYGPGPDHERTFGVIGIEGLAPYWFQVTPALFVSRNGDVSARLETTYDLLLSQRLIAQPRFEINAAAQDARQYGVERGVNDVELGMRLRYEIRREFAPYVGFNWTRKIGDTADLARREGEDVDVVGFIAGFRLWF